MSNLKENEDNTHVEISEDQKVLNDVTSNEYKWGFVTDIESETVPKGLNEDIVRMISKKKDEPEWMTDWRIKAFRYWKKMTEPKWPNVKYPVIDYQDISYYSAPNKNQNSQV